MKNWFLILFILFTIPGLSQTKGCNIQKDIYKLERMNAKERPSDLFTHISQEHSKELASDAKLQKRFLDLTIAFMRSPSNLSLLPTTFFEKAFQVPFMADSLLEALEKEKNYSGLTTAGSVIDVLTRERAIYWAKHYYALWKEGKIENVRFVMRLLAAISTGESAKDLVELYNLSDPTMIDFPHWTDCFLAACYKENYRMSLSFFSKIVTDSASEDIENCRLWGFRDIYDYTENPKSARSILPPLPVDCPQPRDETVKYVTETFYAHVTALQNIGTN